MPNIPHEVVAQSVKDEKNSRTLKVSISENGELVLAGYDVGDVVRELWGHDDYEYQVTVPAEYKDYALLLLIKERFETSSAFTEWLQKNDIPQTFSSWP